MKAGTPWAERLAARMNGVGDDEDIASDAADWNMCSVAEKLGFPDVSGQWLRGFLGDETPALQNAGVDFFDAVEAKEYKRAAAIHREIQSRYGDDAARVREAISEMVT